MAGYTSRSLFILALPTCVAICSLLWFLRKRRFSSVGTCNCSGGKEDIGRHICQPIFPLVISMNLVAEGSSFNQLSPTDSSSKMHLKEDSVNTVDQPALCELKANSSAAVQKCKVYENGTTCSNGAAPEQDNTFVVECDKTDDNASLTVAAPSVDCKESKMSDHLPELSEKFELTCKIQTLGSEATPNSLCSEEIVTNGSHISDVDSCRETPSPTDEDKEQTDKATSSRSSEPSAESSADLRSAGTYGKLSCEVDVPKSSSPDSGVSAELQESDNSLSDPLTDEINGESPVVSLASSDSYQDYNENILDSPCSDVVVRYPAAVDVMNERTVYEFEIPQELCGLLIGRNGRYVKYIKEESNADLIIKHHPAFNHVKICAISGNSSEVSRAIHLIRERLPVEQFPSVTLLNTSALQYSVSLPFSMRLSLPVGVSFEVIVVAVVSPGYFFVQQPTQTTYNVLSTISHGMSEWYMTEQAPSLHHYDIGYVVAVPLANAWYRAEIVKINDNWRNAVVKLLDFGGFATVPLISLRQVNFQFLAVAFQTVECALGDITYPEGQDDWSVEAKSAFERLAQGQIIQGYIVGYTENGLPQLHLYKVQGASTLLINDELVAAGVAQRVASE